VLGLVLLTAVSWFAAWASAGRSVKSDSRTAPESPGPPVFEIDEQRNLLSRWLATALVATGAVLAFAVLDSIGQTFYLVAMQPGRRLFASLFAALSGLAGVAAFAKPIAIAVAGRPDGRRIGLPMAALAWVAALAIMGVLLIAVSVLTHAITWSFRAPVGAPSLSWVLAAPDLADPRCQPEAAPCPRPGRAVVTTAAVWAVAMLFGWLFGRSWPFLNQSSLQSTYSARLTRAYLGASNPLRRIFGNVTRVKPGDNIDAADYWALPSLPGGDPKARPLHFINVTVNETVDGQSQVQQQDRKGTGLAIGPCSFSLGVRHHAVFPEHRALAPERGQQAVAPRVYPAPDVTAAPGVVAPFRVFSNADSGEWRSGEPLPVGTWTGISGAAFSTGMGARTSLGLSLLCGFGNLRLGYWWDSRVTRAGQAPGGAVFSWLERLFPVQAYLLSEFLSRFYGTSRARWYLSDGGHFENMGGYELIRRRLARILIIDAEADPEYTFDGLANLVRKARLDFGAEITFLTAAELTDLVPGPYRALFGGLEELRRGKWTEEPVRVVRTGRKRQSIEDPIDLTRASLAHAALARVRYLDERSRECWLLYLKPTLIGDEPADLAQYHRSHPSFPQETTGDQFFDEAQWESYRMLGYHIATGVFGARLTTAGAGSGLSGTPPSPSQLLFGP
jgi:hypothetical protein